jgi:hypothetical protein
MLKSFSYLIFKFICSAGIFLESPHLREVYVPVSKCSPDLISIMSILTYTARRLMSSSCGPPRPAIAMLFGIGMPMSSSSGPPCPAKALAHRDVYFSEALAPQSDAGWAYKFKHENVIKIKNKPYPGISRTYYLSNKPSAGLFILIKSHETIPLSAFFVNLLKQ